jgi:hypothetical protein
MIGDETIFSVAPFSALLRHGNILQIVRYREAVFILGNSSRCGIDEH